MTDPKQTHVSFSFDPSDAGVQAFFCSELEALIRASAGLMILGYECSGVDYKARRVYFTQLEQESQSTLPAPTGINKNTVEETAVPQKIKECSTCASFHRVNPLSSNGACRTHNYNTAPDDLCDQWSGKVHQ